MPEMKIKKRHEILAFYGITYENEGSTITAYKRMTKFTQLTQNKNPIEYSRQYIDEAYQFSDVVGYAPTIDYAFDAHTNNEVQQDIINITNGEYLGSEAVRQILVVDTNTGDAVLRSYSVIPSTEGDNANIYTYSGSFKANSAPTFGEAETLSDWQQATFTPSGGFIPSAG